MSDVVTLILTIFLEILAFGFINYYAFKLSQKNAKKRIWAGVIFLLLTPLIYFGTLSFVLIFEEGGFGAGILTIFFTGIYLLNGLFILLSSIILFSKKSI